AVRVASGAHQAGLAIAVKDVFVHKTIARLAQVAEDVGKRSVTPRTGSLVRIDVEELDELEAQWGTAL
ncbi:hypothetical protein, partial [Streptomyces sp. ADI98-10]|uniref:hypothetical protein n=1 Tax=Streptomyces sp. ADI98-10 TaxID=1522763 RepID=UPI0013DE42C1